MGFEQEQSAFDDYKWHDVYHNKHRTMPIFKFPTTTTTPYPSVETTAMNRVTTFLEDILTTSTIKADISSASSVTVTEQAGDILNTTFMDMVQATPNSTLILDEATTSNSSVIVGVMESTSNSVFTEMMQNASTPLDVAQNDTILTEAMDDNNGTILTTISDIITSTAENTVSILNSTTEKAVTFVTEVVNTASSSTVKDDNEMHNNFMPHYDHTESHHILYIILCIIIAILLLIGIILLLIYIRYRKHSFRALHNYYEVSPMKESSPNVSQEEQKECPNDLYVQYPC